MLHSHRLFRRVTVWRDIDNEHPKYGAVISRRLVLSLYLGRRLYRVALRLRQVTR
jgi:hypothetical protein